MGEVALLSTPEVFGKVEVYLAAGEKPLKIQTGLFEIYLQWQEVPRKQHYLWC